MMTAIHLMAVSQVPVDTLDRLAAALARAFRVSCHVRLDTLDAAFAFNPVRNQYLAAAILERLAFEAPSAGVRVLGVAAVDLFVPVLTFVFGEAQIGGRAALVSYYRLREEYYGLPARPELFEERLLKEAVHELGHTFGLRHCPDWRCVMASTHAVERLDMKSLRFCTECWETVAVS